VPANLFGFLFILFGRGFTTDYQREIWGNGVWKGVGFSCVFFVGEFYPHGKFSAPEVVIPQVIRAAPPGVMRVAKAFYPMDS